MKNFAAYCYGPLSDAAEDLEAGRVTDPMVLAVLIARLIREIEDLKERAK